MKLLKCILSLSVLFLLQPLSFSDSKFYGDSFGIDPHLNWKVIETEHFKIHYDPPTKEVAIRVSQLYEEAHEVLKPLMRWEAKYKPSVILADNSDSANGLSAATLRIGMVLYLTPPENWSSIATYDDWFRLLIFHEYTHFLNMDPVRGFWTALRWIFGDAIRPNSLWTRWMLEGLAVYIETAYTKSGRGRSSEWEMVLRAAYVDKVLGTPKYVTLDRINGEYPYPPYGEASYFYGYQLMNQVTLDLENKKRTQTFDKENVLSSSEDILGLMSYRSAKRVPWFISGNLENISGKNWKDYWDDFISLTKIRMRDQLKVIQSQKTTPVQVLTNKNDNNMILGVALAPNEEFLVYSKKDKDERMHLYSLSLKDQKEKRILKNSSGAGLSISADSKKVFFSGMRRQNEYYTLSDIGVYDVEKDSVQWLTDEARVRDPAVSPDSKFLAYAQVDKGSIYLAEAQLKNNAEGTLELVEASVVFKGKLGSKVSQPVYSKDGQKIYFSFHDNETSEEAIVSYDRTTKEVSTLLKDGHYNRFLQVSENGDLYFTSTQTGVENIYRYDFTEARSEMLTNVLTGVRFPAVTKNRQAYVAHYTYKGWDLAQVPLAEIAYDADTLKIQGPYAPVSPAEKKETLSQKKYDFKEKEYSPWSSLKPRAWTPSLIAQNDGVYAGIVVTGFDTIDRHRYVLSGGADFTINEYDGQAIYQNRSFGPTITLGAGHYTSGRGFLGYTLMEYTRTLSLSAFLSPPFTWTYSSLSPYIGVLLEQDKFYELPNQSTPYRISPYVPIYAVGLKWGNSENPALSVSPQSGGILNVDARMFDYRPSASFKGFFSYQHFFHLGMNHVVTPVVGGAQASRAEGSVSSSSIELSGYTRNPFRLLNDVNLYSIDAITLRGYSAKKYLVNSVYFGTFEYRFPIYRIFRGITTRPVFFRNIYGFTFVDYLYVPLSQNRKAVFSAAGGGVRMTMHLFHLVPLTLSAEYHYGFNKRLGGRSEGIGAVIFNLTDLISGSDSKTTL